MGLYTNHPSQGQDPSASAPHLGHPPGTSVPGPALGTQGGPGLSSWPGEAGRATQAVTRNTSIGAGCPDGEPTFPRVPRPLLLPALEGLGSDAYGDPPELLSDSHFLLQALLALLGPPWPFTPFPIARMTAGFGLPHKTRMKVSPIIGKKRQNSPTLLFSLSFDLPSRPTSKWC